MKILEIETFGRGGLIHYTFNLSCALAQRGHEVTLVTTAGYELDTVAEAPANVRVLKAIGRSTGTPGPTRTGLMHRLSIRAEALRDAIAVGRLARRLQPDIVHLHCTNPVAVAYLAALRLSGSPVVSTAHVVTPHEPVPLQGLLYRAIHHLSDHLVAHSEVDRRRLIDEFAVDLTRVTVIPHGEYGFFQETQSPPDRLVARKRLGLASHEEVALFFGYVREYKGLDLLLDAWPTVVAARPQARLVVAGDPVRLAPSQREALQARATELGAVLRFEYIPFSEVTQYFSAADVLVMPYRRISHSGVLFLALALGVPLVASRVGPLPDLLTEGESAVLIPPESSSALAEALIATLGDPGLRHRLASGGRGVADQHSWESIARQTEHTFGTLLPNRAPTDDDRPASS